jgi:CubicO group peptidase (beta-lactamase class C family)
LALVATIGGAEAADPKTVDAVPLRSSQRLVQAVRLLHAQPPMATLSSEMRRLNVPALSIAVVRNGSILWAKGYGRVRIDGPATSVDTRFQAASISKTVTAVAVLRLVEVGQLNLDQDVNQYLKSWNLTEPPGARVTLRELLSHTGGVNVGGFPGYPVGTPVPTLLQVLDGTPPAITGAVRVDSRPGASWRYSGGGYTIVQQVLMDVTGKSFPDLMQELVFDPAGMRESSFSQPLPNAELARIAIPYSANGHAIQGGPHTYPELAAAGMWTTPTDLARFLVELQRCVAGKGTLLSAATAKEAFTPGLGDWGLGFQIQGSGASYRFAHPGANEGYRIQLVGYVNRPDGAVIMTNGDGGKTLADEVLRTIAAQYHWKGYEPDARSVVAPSPQYLDSRVGIYLLADKRTLHIKRNGKYLQAQISDNPAETLYSDDGKRFFSTAGNIDMRWNTVEDISGTISIDGGPFQAVQRQP